MVLASSTVIVPSLPTLSIASAILEPISSSPLAEMTATCLTSSEVVTFFACLAMAATTAAVALSMPRLMLIGLEPAVTFFRPSR